MNQPSHRISQAETVCAIEDVVLTQRYQDYLVEPQALRAEVSKENYELLFSEPYIDPDAYRSNPIPEFMVTALVRMFLGLLDYAFMIRCDPLVAVNSYWVLEPQQAALKALGYDVFVTEYQERFFSQLVCLRTPKGLFFAPLDMLAHPTMQECLQMVQLPTRAELQAA